MPAAADPESAPTDGGWAPSSLPALGILAGLAISGPTFFIEEFWHGRPLIDQGGLWWVIPAVVMAAGFLVGGMIAGRSCARGVHAFWIGVLVAALTVWLIFIADLIRRHELGQRLTNPVLGLWLAAAVGAILVGGIGAMVGWSRRRSGQNQP